MGPLVIKLCVIVCCLGGTLLLFDTLSPALGDKVAFGISFTPIALFMWGALFLEDERDRFSKLSVGIGCVGVGLLFLLNLYAVAFLLKGGEHRNPGLLWFGIAVSVPISAYFLREAKRFFTASPEGHPALTVEESMAPLVDRRMPYRPKPWVMMASTAFFVLCAAVFIKKATEEQCVMTWLLLGMSCLFVLAGSAGIYFSFFSKKILEIREDVLILPPSRRQPDHTEVRRDEWTQASVLRMNGQAFLRFEHGGRLKSITLNWLSKEDKQHVLNFFGIRLAR